MKNKKAYDFIMAILSFVTIAILSMELILNYNKSILQVLNHVDNFIWVIFFIDYVVTLICAKDKCKFIKNNIIKVFVIIPTSMFLSFFYLLNFQKYITLFKMIKFIKLIRIIILLENFRIIISKVIEINLLTYAIAGTINTMFLGAIGISIAEEISFWDALWWSFVTATTVGYGDITPRTVIGKCIASILMVSGIVFISMLTGAMAANLLNKNNKKQNYRDKVIDQVKDSLDEFDKLSEKELEDIYKVLRSLKK